MTREELIKVLEQAESALSHSEPLMKHYPEPVEHHAAAHKSLQVCLARLHDGEVIAAQ